MICQGCCSIYHIGDIGLPDIQRPFLWSNKKVRDLSDSMCKGFPTGYLLFWVNAHNDDVRPIGTEGKKRRMPNRLIADCQQRLTSLYAVFYGQKVIDKNYKERRIEIAFRPRDGKFMVSGAATRKDPEFIPDISVLWTSGKGSWSIINEFLAGLEEKQPLLDVTL